MKQIEPTPKPIATERNGHLPLPEIQVYGVSEDKTEEEQWDLNWLGAVFQRRWPVMLGVAIATTAISGAFIWLRDSSAPPLYTGSFELLVEPVTAEAQATRQTTSAQGEALGSANVQQSRLDYETQIRILRSPQLLQPLVAELQPQYADVSPELVEQMIRNNLLVERVTYQQDGKQEGTRIIRVAYQGESPEAVLFTLEQLSDLYLTYALEERQTNIDQAVRFIDQQIPALQAQVDDLQTRLQAFRETYTLIDPQLEGSQLTQQAGQLRQQRLESDTTLAEARARYRELLSNDPVAILGEAPEYGTLLSLFQELEGELAIEAARMTDLNPEMQYLQERRSNILGLINQEAQRVLSKVEDQIRVLEDRNQSIAQSEQQIQQQIRELPAAAKTYDELQRQLTIATSILTEFSARQSALRVDAAQQQTPWELINPPTLLQDPFGEPLNIAGLSKTRYLALALVLGSLLGIGVGFLVEVVSDRYHTVGEIQQTTKLPILGEIPQQPGLSHGPQPQSPLFLEAFRSLLTKISLLNPAQPLRTLTISSTTPQEGKSTTSLYLAQTAASLGWRVLLVDADLRRPQIHERLGLSNQVGLSDLLTNPAVTYRQALQRRSPDSSLYVLTAGSPTPNPIRLLASSRMQAIAKEFGKAFDLVIYDTPPTDNLADASIVATYTAGMVMVVKLGHLKREKLLKTLESLKMSNLPILGVVANHVPLDPQDAYTYQQYLASAPSTR